MRTGLEGGRQAGEVRSLTERLGPELTGGSRAGLGWGGAAVQWVS